MAYNIKKLKSYLLWNSVFYQNHYDDNNDKDDDEDALVNDHFLEYFFNIS